MAASAKPKVRHAGSGKVQVAYQVLGRGSVNLVLTPWSVSHLDYFWEEPALRRFLEALGGFANVAIFDKRGTGLSDRNSGAPTFEERVDDLRTVMDAAMFNDAVLVGMSEGVPTSILFAASNPSRTRGLVLIGGGAKGMRAPDYPWGGTKEQYEASFKWARQNWGSKNWEDRAVSILAPTRVGDAAFTRWLGDLRRNGASLETSIALAKSEMMTDVRGVIPAVNVPTLVVSIAGDKACDRGEGQYLAANIPGANLIELPGADHMFFVDPDLANEVAREVERFATSVGPTTPTDRALTTVLSTEIFDLRHNSIVRDAIQKFGGREVKNTGGIFLATFDAPTWAVRCAWAVTLSAKELKTKARAGIHTGVCVLGLSDVGGIAVDLASPILNEAKGGEVMTSEIVKNLAYGSPISFRDRGERKLKVKGVEETHRLFSVERIG